MHEGLQWAVMGKLGKAGYGTAGMPAALSSN